MYYYYRYLCTILRLLSDKEASPGSMDRLSRVCGFTRYNNTNIIVDLETEFGTPCLNINDPALTLLSYGDQLFLAIINVCDILQNGVSTYTLPVEAVNDPSVRIKFQVLSLRTIAPIDQNGGVDWEWNGQVERAGSAVTQEVDGRGVQVLDPVPISGVASSCLRAFPSHIHIACQMVPNFSKTRFCS